MKTIAISLLSVLLSITLFARENPFEPTDQFLEEKEVVLQEQIKAEAEKIIKEQEQIAAKIVQEQEREAQILAEKQKEDELAKTIENDTIAPLDKKNLPKKMEKTLAFVDQKEQENIEKTVEPYIPTIKENFKVLSFVKIDVTDDILTIQVDPKYQLLNQDILKPEKKFLFDFQGTVSFYTVRNKIVSEDFDSFAVGTHMEKNYFRVVINLPLDVSEYIETVYSKKGIITLKKK